jgi:hypothetical protein
MKRTLSLAFLLLAAMILLPSRARAQSCGGMYTYDDAQFDDYGNMTALSYSDASSSACGYAAYASITVTMPSGYSPIRVCYGLILLRRGDCATRQR